MTRTEPVLILDPDPASTLVPPAGNHHHHLVVDPENVEVIDDGDAFAEAAPIGGGNS